MSLSNRQLKYLASLSQKKYRQQHQQVIIEGVRLCEEALRSDWVLREAYVTSDFFTHSVQSRLKRLAGEKHLTLQEISPEEMERITDTRSPQSIAILADLPEQKQFIPDRDRHPQILMLDRVSDPGNLGTLCRSADWFGVRHILFGPGSVEWSNPKVLRSSMGSVFRIQLVEIADWTATMSELEDSGYVLLGAGMAGKEAKTVSQSLQNQPWALLLGNEAHGLSEELTPSLDEIMTIPGNGPADSLNVAMAGTVLLYELATSSSKL